MHIYSSSFLLYGLPITRIEKNKNENIEKNLSIINKGNEQIANLGYPAKK